MNFVRVILIYLLCVKLLTATFYGLAQTQALRTTLNFEIFKMRTSSGIGYKWKKAMAKTL